MCTVTSRSGHLFHIYLILFGLTVKLNYFIDPHGNKLMFYGLELDVKYCHVNKSYP